MSKKIEQDHARFKRIVRGHVRKELKKFMSQGELIGRKGKGIVSIPIPQIDTPRFRFNDKKAGGIGQGDGEVGTPLDDQDQDGTGKAGDQPGSHILEAEITLEELALIMGEELKLPFLEPKGNKNITAEKIKYTGISKTGPRSLRHMKRTYLAALKGEIGAGTYNADDPLVIPQPNDWRYRTFKKALVPEANAVIIYMMDVSGSMGPEQKEIARLEAFWIDCWIRLVYKRVEVRYIVHDAAAKEVDEDTFYHLREGGGTRISSAYNLCRKILREQFPFDTWNPYLFHFSDGDNWDGEDSQECVNILQNVDDSLLGLANLFCYAQVKSAYGSGDFIGVLKELDYWPNLRTSMLRSTSDVWDSIQSFFGGEQ